MTAFLGLVFILVSLLAFLVFARSVFGWVARAEGYSLTVETTVHDNTAVGVRFGLFLLASAMASAELRISRPRSLGSVASIRSSACPIIVLSGVRIA